MVNNAIITTKGKNIMLYRAYTDTASLSSTQYLELDQAKVGISGANPNIANTNLSTAIPIGNGTVNDDGDNQMTGSNGGSNTTDNTTTFKPGAGATDDKSQNLIATTGNATKTWTISNLATNGTNVTGTEYVGLWIYIKDSTALAKFKSSGTCFEFKLGSDVSNYYSKTYTASDLAVGWNFITSNTTAVEDLTETGTVSGNIDTFILEITTNNTSDTFSAGDVVYDLLRTWDDDDLVEDLTSGYPTFDYSNNEVTTRFFLNSTKANGFDIDNLGMFNQDTTPLMGFESKFTSLSKTNNEEFAFVIKSRIL